MIERRGRIWETWVEIQPFSKYAGEWGTYSWSRKRAIKKGRRLLRKYEASRPRDREVFE